MPLTSLILRPILLHGKFAVMYTQLCIDRRKLNKGAALEKNLKHVGVQMIGGRVPILGSLQRASHNVFISLTFVKAFLYMCSSRKPVVNKWMSRGYHNGWVLQNSKTLVAGGNYEIYNSVLITFMNGLQKKISWRWN